MATDIQVKRVYDDPSGSETSDGYRVYVDRLWPRGESKEKFHYDLWAKDVSPSATLREWFHEDMEGRWAEFVERYDAELSANEAVPPLIAELRRHPLVTLLYSSRDSEHNNAVALAAFLAKRL